MPHRYKIPLKIQSFIRERANYLCEYCHTSEKWQYVRFTIDHITPISMGGLDDLENLCLACFHCNRKKGAVVSGVDTDSGEKAGLFNPRRNEWNGHFIWSPDKLLIIGLTAIGRATVDVLEMNRERAIRIRAADLFVGRHPPSTDNIQDIGK